MQLKGPERQKQTQEENKKEWASSVGLRQRHKPQHLHHVKVSSRGHITKTSHFFLVAMVPFPTLKTTLCLGKIAFSPGNKEHSKF